MDISGAVNENSTDEVVNDELQSSDEDLIINLEAVKIESVIELEHLDEVEHHISIDKVSDSHSWNQEQ